MVKIKPVKYKDIYKKFGDHGKEATKSFITAPLPFPLVGSRHTITEIIGHKYMIPSLVDALEEIKNYYGKEFIVKNKLNTYHGVYANRKTSSDGKWWSVHSWGLAIDLLANLGPKNTKPITPYHFVCAFKKRGFIWGGDWKKYPDGMHFSAIIEG